MARDHMKRLYCALFCLVALFVSGHDALSQTYPTRPIKVIAPYPAGDLADVIARLLADDMAKDLGQPIVVDNRPGASGLIGLQTAANAEPDGYTFVLGQLGNVAITPQMNKWPFNVREALEPVALTYTNYVLIVATPTLPVKTLSDLIAYAKTNPGGFRVATNGLGSFPHLVFELLRKQSGLNFEHVPYRGGVQVLPDLMAGRVDVTALSFSTLYPYHQDGRLRGIATTGRQRPSVAPDMPTVAETVPGFEVLGWFGYFAPKGTPAAIVNRFNAAVNKAMKNPEIEKQIVRLGLDAAPGTPAEFAQLWQKDYERLGGIIRDLGLDASAR